MDVMRKRGQVAMEFLMTYGWAIIIILLAIAALWLLGVFNFDAPSKCTMTAPFNCNDVILLDNAVLFKIASGSVLDASVVNIQVNGKACPKIIGGAALSSNSETIIKCTGLSFEEDEAL